jgi:SAM-dependent methyltransferase
VGIFDRSQAVLLSEGERHFDSDAQRWDARYRAELPDWLDRGPHQLLLDHSSLLPDRGLALDAAAGVGRDSLYLARRGLRVIALDISRVALQAAAQAARHENLPLYPVVYDLASPWFPPDRFDLILNFHFLERGAFPVYSRALKPGGLILIETFARTADDPTGVAYYLEPGELSAAFADFEHILYEETGLPPGRRHPARGLARLVARKPFRVKTGSPCVSK